VAALRIGDCGFELERGRANLQNEDEYLFADQYILSPPRSVRGSAGLSVQNKAIEDTARNNFLEGRRAPPGDALYSDGVVGHRSCDRITFDPSAAAPSK
jgi:hypothetical protein